MAWSINPPDLSPIEHVWGIIGRKLSTSNHPLSVLAHLIHKVQIIWNGMPQENSRPHVILSMVRCVQLQDH